jgi:AcrR family transcriptional regulator
MVHAPGPHSLLGPHGVPGPIGVPGPVGAPGPHGLLGPLSRRDRVRAATTQEILQTARKLLVEQGAAAISLRAIAREMGMTAPALYRYFGSHEELLRHVVGDIFTDLASHVRAAIEAAAQAPGPRLPADDLLAVKLIAGCREFRAWALEHVSEFDMIFGSPLPELHLQHDDPVLECGYQFGQVFLDLFGNLYRRRPFSIPPDDQIDPTLRSQLARYRELTGSDLPLGALLTFLRCWVLLYGTVALEVSGNLKFALDDATPMFELMLADLAPMVGLDYPPQAPR